MIFYRSWNFPTKAETLTVSETQIPNRVQLKIGNETTLLTEEQFRELGKLSSPGAYKDYVRFVQEDVE